MLCRSWLYISLATLCDTDTAYANAELGTVQYRLLIAELSCHLEEKIWNSNIEPQETNQRQVNRMGENDWAPTQKRIGKLHLNASSRSEKAAWKTQYSI